MIQNIKKHAKKILVSLVFAKALTFGTPALAKDGFFNIQPAYNTTQEHSTLRLEGGSNITENLNCYGYLDADATQEKPLDMESFYSEFRVNHSLAKISDKMKNVGVAVEYNGGNEAEDVARFGLTWTPEIHKDNFTLLKLYPYETSEEKGPQIGFFSSQKIFKKFGLSALVDYNFNPKKDKKTIYFEPEANAKITNDLEVFAQGRYFGEVNKEIEKMENWGIVVGGKYHF